MSTTQVMWRLAWRLTRATSRDGRRAPIAFGPYEQLATDALYARTVHETIARLRARLAR